MAITEELIKDFEKTQKAPESQRKETVGSLCNDIVEGYRAKHFSVSEDVDFEKLIDGCVSKDTMNTLRNNKCSTGKGLVEAALDVMSSTAFPDLLSTNITVGMLEFCERAPMTVMSLVRTVDMGCGQEAFYGYSPLGDIVDDECLDEGEPTPYKGICPPNKITPPKRCKKKFAMGIAREMLCYDVNNQIQQLMRTGAEIATLHNGRIMLNHMFGLYGTSQNPYPFLYNDVPYDNFYAQTGSPWQNRLVGNNLDGSFGPFDAIEDFQDAQRDPVTGQPTQCDFRDILVTSTQSRDFAIRGLNQMNLSWDLPAAVATAENMTNGRIEQVRAADGRFGRLIYDRYASDLLADWYENGPIGADATDSADAAKRTYMVGDFSRAFAWAVEWPFETLERQGNDTREYFDQEIVFQIKYLWKAAPMSTAPWAVLQCVPDMQADYASVASWTWA
jgi:hypothetical protein